MMNYLNPKNNQLFFSDLERFFANTPALLFGIIALLATYFAITWNLLSLSIFTVLMTCLYLSRQRVILPYVVFFTLFCCYSYQAKNPNPPHLIQHGYFELESITPSRSFMPSPLYRGKVYWKDGSSLKELPILLIAPKSSPKLVSQLCFVSLKQIRGTTYKLQSFDKKCINRADSVVLKRYQYKQSIKKVLKKHVHDKRVINLLSALITGQNDDLFIHDLFSRLGLQHLLAISGFHFSLVIGFAALIMRFFPMPIKLTTLIALTLLYFAFLGQAPSIFRACIAIVATLVALLINKTSNPINVLGLCLLVSLIDNPLVAFNLGFQLSFIATLSLLITYPVLSQFLEHVLPRRTYDKKASWIQRIGVTLGTFYRNAIALNLSVTLLTLPIILHQIGSFPLLSLYYNIVIPPWIAFIMLLLIISICISPLTTLGFFATEVLAKECLNWMLFYPKTLSLSIEMPFKNIVMTSIAVFVSLVLSMTLYERLRRTEVETT